MPRRTRAEMIEQTRAKLVAAARVAFGTQGYANTSMDDFTASVGLTRGALYHHFGDKTGLLAAVVEQIDEETDARLQAVSDAAPDTWEGFRNRCRAYLQMAQEPEMRRIVLQDARAVLGGASAVSQQFCVVSMAELLDTLMQKGVIRRAEPQALARLIYGALAEGAFWVAEPAGAGDGQRLAQAQGALDVLLDALPVA
ncbi:TetR/AcrR family transcriptional regulator [Bordetella sp. BOR01]|uniref:TetR/AcrR family transcriptional regulator n=1 Tax=Bordetella sp. BOR01 TaxID=2854779 RepID=UPI001C44447F|nr:TetR/AcrR family transcriptional regulator [Bordetella sp. BOR01]MBV7482635.1 TetR/AcrR family transcriptional regulator [Bordetella sp. BOR01]